MIRQQPEMIMLKKRKFSFDGPFQLPHADVGNLEFL